MSKIFISIACFADPDIINTIDSCLKTAKHPENLTIGVCLQYDPEDFFFEKYENHPQVKLIKMHYSEAKGPAFARYKIYKLFLNEDFFFQIDCHTRFYDNWDEKLLNCYNECLLINKKSIISYYPEPLTRWKNNPQTITNITTVRLIKKNVGIKTHAKYIPLSKCPEKSWGVSAAMLFFDKNTYKEIPFDDEIYFGYQFEEQVVLAARYWTSGYDIFTPSQHIIGTEYLTNARRQKVKLKIDGKQQHDTFKKMCHIMKLEYNKKYENCTKSKLGNVRTIEDYYKMLNIYDKVKEIFINNFLEKTTIEIYNKKTIFDIIFSINVHEKIDFLIEQLKNIIFFTNHLKVCIIYNCNKFMLNILNKINFNCYKNIKIIVNPVTIEKRRWHGSLCKGIIKNMEYVVNNNIVFKHFIILSSRNILTKKLELTFIKEKYDFYYNNIVELVKDEKRFYFNKLDKFFICDGSKQDYWHVDMTPSRFWFWGKINNTNWFKKLNKQVDFFIGGKHEALCIYYDNILKIVDFCKNNDDILSECYIYNIALEEVIPQVLACKFATNNKMYCLLEPPIIKIQRNIEDIKKERKKWEK